jgi:hypothetical protein
MCVTEKKTAVIDAEARGKNDLILGFEMQKRRANSRLFS